MTAACTCPEEVRSGDAPVPDPKQPHLAACPEWVKPPMQYATTNVAREVMARASSSGGGPKRKAVDVLAKNTAGKTVRLKGPKAARFLRAVMECRPPGELAELVDEIS